MQTRFLRLPELRRLTGLSTATIYNKARAGVFPKPIKIGEKSSGWVASEVEEWAQARIEASREESKP